MSHIQNKILNNNATTKTLEAGEVIIFHPLLLHQGCTYTIANTRLHLYLDPVGYIKFVSQRISEIGKF